MSAGKKRMLVGDDEEVPRKKACKEVEIIEPPYSDDSSQSTLNPTTPTDAPLDLTQPSFKPKREWANIPKPSIDPIAIARFHAEEIPPGEEEEVEEEEEEEEEDEDDEVENSGTGEENSVIPKQFEDLATMAQYSPGANLQAPWDDPSFWETPDVLDSSPAFFFRLYKHALKKKYLMVMKRENQGGNPSIFIWRASLAKTFLRKVLIPLGKKLQKEHAAKVVGEQKFWHPDWTVFFSCTSTKRLRSERIYVKPYSFRGKAGVVVRLFQESERPLERLLENGEKYTQYGSFATLTLSEFYLMCSRINQLLRKYAAIQADNRKRRQASHQPAIAA
ncbi:unnamed protein product [Orchesella dallaii]|uniref:Uncharacterized protein n=1 Tax=Orchesella dallaii TaxID=48710 RepID=A0ABP1PTZ6_9HEXA